MSILMANTMYQHKKDRSQLIVAVFFVRKTIDHADYVSSKQTTDNSAHDPDDIFYNCSHAISSPLSQKDIYMNRTSLL